jgi:hypothetical protein
MNTYGVTQTDASTLIGMLPKRMPVTMLQQGTPFKRHETKGVLIVWGVRTFASLRAEIEASPHVTTFIMDSRMRFRGTNIPLIDKEEGVNDATVLTLLKKQTRPIKFRKPPSIIASALEKNRDNSILGLMLHTKYRISRSPEKQKQLQTAFVRAIMYKDYTGLRFHLPEPLLSQLLGIIQGELGTNLAEAVKAVKKGVAIAKAAQQNDVTTFDIQYLVAYLKHAEKTSK